MLMDLLQKYHGVFVSFNLKIAHKFSVTIDKNKPTWKNVLQEINENLFAEEKRFFSNQITDDLADIVEQFNEKHSHFL